MEVDTGKGVMRMGPHQGGYMTVETVKVYKGSKSVIVNKDDVDGWREQGWQTSSDRQKSSKKKAEPKEDK